jgi:hypothetical protein
MDPRTGICGTIDPRRVFFEVAKMNPVFFFLFGMGSWLVDPPAAVWIEPFRPTVWIEPERGR